MIPHKGSTCPEKTERTATRKEIPTPKVFPSTLMGAGKTNARWRGISTTTLLLEFFILALYLLIPLFDFYFYGVNIVFRQRIHMGDYAARFINFIH